MKDLFMTIFPIFFLIIWISVGFLLSHTSGWPKLAKNYRSKEKFQGERWYTQWAKLGGTYFRGVINFGSNNQGLYIWVLFPFNIGTPPLFIPWNDIRAKAEKGFFIDTIILTFNKEHDIELIIQKKLWDKIKNKGRIPVEVVEMPSSSGEI